MIPTGQPPKPKHYRVVEVEEIDVGPPKTILSVYKLEIISTGKLLDKVFNTLEEAERECEILNKNAYKAN